MKTLAASVCVFFLLGGILRPAAAQSGFDPGAYRQFLEATRDLTAQGILETCGPQAHFYKGRIDDVGPGDFAYMDSIIAAYDLTPAELALLETNHFMVTERLSYKSFADALESVFRRDLPVFVSTDLVLHALHRSYDEILLRTEQWALMPELEAVLDAMRVAYPALVARHAGEVELTRALDDVDLYLTVTSTLLAGAPRPPQRVDPGAVAEVLGWIDAGQARAAAVFTDTPRIIDFSQFTVRGHYTHSAELKRYFRAMMWIGHVDFWLTPPETDPPQKPDDIRRMAMAACLLHELLDLSGERDRLEAIDRFLNVLVGESDNLTPAELAGVLGDLEILSAARLQDPATLAALQGALSASANYGQRILSCILLMDPTGAEPAELPVSFRLLGQRFVVDAHILGQVVFPNIIFQEQRVWRGLPDPLDAMYVLGNDVALPLLRAELETFHYAPQLAGLRYLVDAYDESFWDASLYHTWLQAIRQVGVTVPGAHAPFFVRTAAWQQQKLNTELAAWAELRHDNLLYAKQSYTGGATCFYPHSYVEPYPEFYCQIARFAANAASLFALQGGLPHVTAYFERLAEVMVRLETLARKELAGEAFDAGETQWLRQMLYQEDGGCGVVLDGWFVDLFYIGELAETADYVVADIHTQPTDEVGAPVGNVMHVGVGKIDLGVFLAPSPSQGYEPMAYVGPVMSYFEEVTEDFQRLTDEQWARRIELGPRPHRPDWVNIYLADAQGGALPPGRELTSSAFDPQSPVLEPPPEDPHDPGDPEPVVPWGFAGRQPNPVRRGAAIVFALDRPETVRLQICDAAGRVVATLANGPRAAGEQRVLWDARNLPSGRYYARLQGAYRVDTAELILLR